MRATIDPALCSGHARCAAVAPEVYDLDDDGYGIAPEGEIAAELQESARKGAEACPERAITLR